MLSKIVVGMYANILEASLWLLLLLALIAGWSTNGFVGALVGLVMAFVFGAMFMGAFLVLEDIRKSVKAIEQRK